MVPEDTDVPHLWMLATKVLLHASVQALGLGVAVLAPRDDSWAVVPLSLRVVTCQERSVADMIMPY